MMIRSPNPSDMSSAGLLISSLLDQDNFYRTFIADLKQSRHQVIIESPFITHRRMREFMPAMRRLRQRGVEVVINTKPLEEHDPAYRAQVRRAMAELQNMGVRVLVTGGHHRKLAIIDQAILYEGSLNILSQNDSCEVMRRICSEELAKRMLEFLRLGNFIG